MNAHLDMLDDELAETLARAGARAPQKAPIRSLARDVVGAPKKAPRAGVCIYCGSAAPGDLACAAHSDLPYLDPVLSAVVTDNTRGPSGTHLDGGRARRAREVTS